MKCTRNILEKIRIKSDIQKQLEKNVRLATPRILAEIKQIEETLNLFKGKGDEKTYHTFYKDYLEKIKLCELVGIDLSGRRLYLASIDMEVSYL